MHLLSDEDEEEQQAVVPAGGAHIVQEDGGNEADSSDFTDCLEALLMEEEIEEEWQQVLAQDRKALQRKEREMHRIAVQQSSRLNHTWGFFASPFDGMALVGNVFHGRFVAHITA